MSPFSTLFDDLPHRLGYAAIDVFAVAVLVFAICALLRPRSARVRSLLWLLVPVKGLMALLCGSVFVLGVPSPERLAVLPAVSLPVASPAAAASVSANPAAQRAAAAPATPTAHAAADPATVVAEPGAGSRAFGEWLTIVWLAGMGVLLALSIRDRFRGALLVLRAGPGLPAWQRFAARHAKQLRVRTPQVRRTSGLASPALVGALRPVILIPDWMQCEATVEWAIRHELMHVAMRDPWAALVREAGRIVFFFHPAVWFAGRKWEEATELACDRALVNDDAERLDYADRLHSLACRSHGIPMLAHGMYVARSRVGRRIEALLALPAGPARLTRTGATGVALLFAATLAAGAGAMLSDFVFTGTVRDHEGKPVAGAVVVASLWWMDGPLPAVAGARAPSCVELATANTDASGRFTLGYDKADLPFDPSRHDPWNRVVLTAHAQNHGIDWVYQKDLAKLDAVDLRLPRDYTLKGKLADEDGQPMRGVELRAIGLRTSKDGSLDAWQATLAQGGSLQVLGKQLQVPSGRTPSAVTDETGAFELRGAGAEHIVVLLHKGGDAALGRVWMATREIDPELLAKIQRSRMEPVVSSGGVAIVGRTRPIDGVVVDAATGAPIAGADVYGEVLNGMIDPTNELRTRTDDQGRFRILGMPRGGGNQLVVAARGDEPYFLRDVRVPNPEGLGPIEVRVPLHKGVWITGKVVDGVTGKPVRGQISYHPHLLNPLVLQIDQFKDRTIDGFPGVYRTAADGTFRIPGLPGRGLVGVEAFGAYRFGAGYDPKWDEKTREAQMQRSSFLTHGTPHAPGPDWPNAMALVEIAEGGTPPAVTLTLDPGQTVNATVHDAAGKRTTDYEVKPSGWCNRNVRKTEDGTLEVLRLAPGEKRVVEVRLADGSAGLVTRVTSAMQTATLQMQPPVAIKGVLVDPDGVPLAQRQVLLYLLPEEIPLSRSSVKTDENGRFEMPVFPGCDYQLLVGAGGRTGQEPGLRSVAKSVTVKAGEPVDLGTKRIGD